MDDFFDRAVNFEEEYERAGYAEGLEAGRKLGAAEGRELGIEHGFDIGKDLGFYRGWAQEWLRAASAHPDIVPARALKKLQAIIDAVNDVPTINDENANYEARAKSIQLKFKTVSAMLGVSISTELPSNSLSY